MKFGTKKALYNRKQLAKITLVFAPNTAKAKAKTEREGSYKRSGGQHKVRQLRVVAVSLLIATVSTLSLAFLQVGSTTGGGGVSVAHADGIWNGPESLFEGKWPTVSVRPTDGDVFIIATDYISTIMFGDAKNGYNPVIIASGNGTDPARPRVAFDASGVLHVAWMQRDVNGSGEYDIFYCEISTSGAVSTLRNLTKEIGLGVGRFPDLAVSPVDGKLYLAMEADNASVGVSVSSDNGAHFGRLQTLGQGITGNTGTRIAVGSDGTVHFVFEDGSDIIAKESSDGGNTWTGQTRVDNLGTFHNRSFWPSISTGPSGEAYVVWQEDSHTIGQSEVSFAHWSHTTKKWLPETQNISQAAPGDSAQVPNVAVANSVGLNSGSSGGGGTAATPSTSTTGGNDTIWISWELIKSGGGGGGADYVLSNDGGQTFGSVVTSGGGGGGGGATTSTPPVSATTPNVGIGLGGSPTTAATTTTTTTPTDNNTVVTGPGVIAAPNYSRAGPWNDMTYGAGQVWWAGQLADDSGVYQIWLATTGPNNLNGTGGISLFPPGVNTPASTNLTPTPTVPSWNRPNLHLYFRDANNQPVGGVHATIFKYTYNAATKQGAVTQLENGTSDGASGRVDLDAFALTSNIYYLKLVQANGAVILPNDPNQPMPSGVVGNPDPLLKDMTLLDLTQGSVVYVNTYYLVSEGGGGGQLVAAPNLAKALIYYPPVGSSLAAIAPGPSPTPTEGQPIPANSNTAYVVFTSGIITPTAVPTLPGFTPVVGGGYVGGVGSSNYGVSPGAMGQPHPNSTYTPPPTPTLASCQMGCVQQGNNPVANREAIQAATTQAETVIAQLTAGSFEAGQGGFRGSGSASQYQPNPLYAGSGGGGGSGTPGASSTTTQSAGGSSTPPAAFLSNNNNQSNNDGGSPLAPLLVIGGVGAAVGGGSTVGSVLKAKALSNSINNRPKK